MEYIIKKVRVKNSTLEVDMEEIIHLEGRPSITNDINKKSDQLVHADLVEAFSRLVPHMILVCDQKESGIIQTSLLRTEILPEPDEITDEFVSKAVEPYLVTGFSLAGEGEQAGVVLIGQKRLENKSVLNLIAPFTKFFDYQYGAELSAIINKCVEETELYLFEGKCAEVPNNQLSLFGDDDPGVLDGTQITMSMNDGPEVDITKTMKAIAKKQKAQETEPY